MFRPSKRLLRSHSIIRKKTDANPSSDSKANLLKDDGPTERSLNPLRNFHHGIMVSHAGQNHCEFVAAQASDRCSVSFVVTEPGCYLTQHTVADGVTKRIVNEFESI
tara:strand:+ start:480 stop:800 length:321 start_codon:yes stop_codon:yes gene_type:complete